MKVNLYIGTWSLALLLCGGLMAEQLPQHWVTIKEGALQADFPHRPIEMTFEVPFQNTPPTGHLHLYSVPIQSGVLVLSTFTSSAVNANWLQKEHLLQFFETTLVPYVFFNPSVFQDHQVFHTQSKQIKGEKAISFQISYEDHNVIKKLEGVATVKTNKLYIYFYLASEDTFDSATLQRFVDSVHIAKEA